MSPASQYEPALTVAAQRAMRAARKSDYGVSEPHDKVAELRRLLRDVRADSRRVRDRMVAAENVAALALDHMEGCHDATLREALVEWQYSTGFQPPAGADEVAEASWEARSGK